MTRRLTALFSIFEAALTAAIGIALPLVPLTVLWAAYFGFGVDWLAFWRGALDIWLLGHGVDVAFRLDELTAATLDVPGAEASVPVTIALLGGTVMTLLLAARAGRRIAETGYRILGGLAAVLAFGVISTGLTAVSLHPDARPSLVQAAILPPLVFALGMGIGMLRERSARGRNPGAPAGGSALLERVDPVLLAAGHAALRAGIGAVALTIAVASLVLTAALAVSYAEVIRLYQTLHGEVLGGAIVTLAELAIVPNLVIWTASWLLGPGFALGAGSAVSPLGTVLGPLPALPVLGAVPTGDSPFAYAGVLVPIAAAFLVGAAVRRRLLRDAVDNGSASVRGILPLAGVALGGGVTGALLLAALAAASAGAAGPGRLAAVGPDPVAVGLAAALEFTLAIGAGLAVGDRRARG